jgi:hypothetical protein
VRWRRKTLLYLRWKFSHSTPQLSVGYLSKVRVRVRARVRVRVRVRVGVNSNPNPNPTFPRRGASCSGRTSPPEVHRDIARKSEI